MVSSTGNTEMASYMIMQILGNLDSNHSFGGVRFKDLKDPKLDSVCPGQTDDRPVDLAFQISEERLFLEILC